MFNYPIMTPLSEVHPTYTQTVETRTSRLRSRRHMFWVWFPCSRRISSNFNSCQGAKWSRRADGTVLLWSPENSIECARSVHAPHHVTGPHVHFRGWCNLCQLEIWVCLFSSKQFLWLANSFPPPLSAFSVSLTVSMEFPVVLGLKVYCAQSVISRSQNNSS